jgi:hypothetical protein
MKMNGKEKPEKQAVDSRWCIALDIITLIYADYMPPINRSYFVIILMISNCAINQAQAVCDYRKVPFNSESRGKGGRGNVSI